MRTVGVFLVLLVAATPARADGGFAELAGGIAIPLGDNTWTNDVSSSPKLVARVGTMAGELGGALSVDWTNGNLNANLGQLGNLSANRFRILANLVFHHPVAPKIRISARVGAGVDIAHESYQVLGVSGSATDTGIAFEFAGGLWFRVGDTTELGAELGLPIGYHSSKGGNVDFDYTSYDLDLLFGIRLR